MKATKMRMFFSFICICSVIAGAYCWLSPLPSMHARYRCFCRYGTLHDIPNQSSTNCLSKTDLSGSPDRLQKEYTNAIDDGNVIAEQYATLNLVSLILCALLFACGLTGVGLTTGTNISDASKPPKRPTNE